MGGVNYARFETEEELLKDVLRSLPYDAYPKVSAIGGKKISPDIDILQIARISQSQFRLIGYEIKLMKLARAKARDSRQRWQSPRDPQGGRP
jgi:hypothetical protein